MFTFAKVAVVKVLQQMHAQFELNPSISNEVIRLLSYLHDSMALDAVVVSTQRQQGFVSTYIVQSNASFTLEQVLPIPTWYDEIALVQSDALPFSPLNKSNFLSFKSANCPHSNYVAEIPIVYNSECLGFLVLFSSQTTQLTAIAETSTFFAATHKIAKLIAQSKKRTCASDEELSQRVEELDGVLNDMRGEQNIGRIERKLNQALNLSKQLVALTAKSGQIEQEE